jgi:hypothetical protein
MGRTSELVLESVNSFCHFKGKYFIETTLSELKEIPKI